MSYNSPDIKSIQEAKDKIDIKIQSLQEIGLPGIKDIPKTLWKNLIEPKLLTQRQIAKKIIMVKGEDFDPPITEEYAQLIVYGKVMYQGNELVDNDKETPECVAQKGEADYQTPINKNHQIWEDVEETIKGLKTKLFQLGVKLGEFISAIPAAIANIVTSLISMVASAIILPFGSGLPAALSAVMTMLATLKTLQAKAAELLPLIGVVNAIGLVLPKEAQAIVAQMNIIYGLLLGIITGITAIMSLLGGVTSLFNKKKDDMDNQKMKLKAKSDPSKIEVGETATLTAESTGGDWDFKYRWTSESGQLISTESEIDVKPYKTTTYTCRIVDGKGTVKIDTVKVKVD